MIKKSVLKKSAAGFSLLEVLVVLALTALILVSFGAKFADVTGYLPRFSTTCLMMEEIKEALVGKHNYSGGIRQFSGYISDMGTMPSLFYEDENGEIRRLNKTESIWPIIETARALPQPVALWSWDFKHDGSRATPPDRLLWQYHPSEKIWAGWKGPYLKPPERGFLEDAWGNQFLFLLGNLVSLQDPATGSIKTYRCIKTHILSSVKDPALTPPAPGLRKPGTVDGRDFWEELVDADGEPVSINAHSWVGLPRFFMDNNNRQDIYYDDVVTIISFGKDGKPGCGKMDRIIVGENNAGQMVEWKCADQYAKDLIITVYKQEYAAEVAGHAGYKNETAEQLFARVMTLCYPRFDDTANGGGIERTDINLSLTDHKGKCADKGFGINFRFGTAPARSADSFRCENCQREPDQEAGCVCINRENKCVKWSCTGQMGVCEYQGSDFMADFLSPCPYEGSFGNCMRNVICNDIDDCFADTECIEYEEGDCLAFRCDQEPDAGCDCTADYEFITDVNSAFAEMTPGVRSIITNTDKTIIFPAIEGANYLGTVK